MTHVVHHLQWGAESLWESLVPLLPGISVEVQARTESTNTRLLERARAFSGNPESPVTRPGELDGASRDERTPHGRRSGDISPCLLVAEEQTRGRGRLGRDWVSSAGASLTFSLSMPLAPQQWGGLSLAVGLAVAEALDPQPFADAAARPRIALKWPNDLWLLDGPGRGRKLGGVLIETVSVGNSRMCVVGVGLNVTPQPAPVNATTGAVTGAMTGAMTGPSTSTSATSTTGITSTTNTTDGMAHGYACLQELDAQASAPLALALVAKPLVLALQRFEAEGFAPVVAAYARRDLLRGQRVTTTMPDALDGVAEGVDELGALCVRSGDGGGLHRVVSGEVSVRLLAST